MSLPPASLYSSATRLCSEKGPPGSGGCRLGSHGLGPLEEEGFLQLLYLGAVTHHLSSTRARDTGIHIDDDTDSPSS